MTKWFGAHYNQEVRFSSAAKCKKGTQVLTSLLNQRRNYYYYCYYCRRSHVTLVRLNGFCRKIELTVLPGTRGGLTSIIFFCSIVTRQSAIRKKNDKFDPSRYPGKRRANFSRTTKFAVSVETIALASWL